MDSFSVTFTPSAAALQADGKIVMAGHRIDYVSGQEQAEVRRFLPGGQPDSTFGTNGKMPLSGVSTKRSSLSDITILPDGSILVGGFTADTTDPYTHSIIAHLSADGAMDPNFGYNGVQTIVVMNTASDAIGHLLVQPDGSILGSGNIQGGSLVEPELFITRLTSAGQLDSSFAGGGVQSSLLPDSWIIFGGANIALQSGEIVLATGAHTSWDATDEIVLARFNSDGSPDTSFGGGAGTVVTDIQAPQDLLTGLATQQPDGKIVLTGGRLLTASNFLVARLNADGTPDASFGTGGIADIDLGTSSDYAQAVAVQSDGKLIIVGGIAVFDPTVIPRFHDEYGVLRLNLDGTPDTSFGNNGIAITDLSSGAQFETQEFFNVALQADGSILGEGIYQDRTTPRTPILVRYLSDGTLDNSFGTNAELLFSIPGSTDTQISSFWPTADGRYIIVEGVETNQPLSGTPTYSGFVARLNADGSFDPSFGMNGVVIIDNGSANVTGVRFDPDPTGEIYVAGIATQAGSSNGSSTFVLTRLNADGSADHSFGAGGTVAVPLASTNDVPVEARRARDGGFVIVGTRSVPFSSTPGTQQILVMRLDAMGQPDSSFAATGSTETFDPSGTGTTGSDVFTDGDGRIVVTGRSGPNDGTSWWAAIRLLGATAPATFSISGTAYNDANHNGARDGGEVGLAGVTIFIDTNKDGFLDPGDRTATTDAQGDYAFNDLQPGTYTVRQVVPRGYAVTAPLGDAATVALSAGQNAAGPSFGDVLVSSVPLDFSYLVTLARHYGQAGTFASGDLNGDGKVDFADLVILARNYGHALGAAAPAGAATSPASLLTPWLAGASVLPVRRRTAHRPWAADLLR